MLKLTNLKWPKREQTNLIPFFGEKIYPKFDPLEKFQVWPICKQYAPTNRSSFKCFFFGVYNTLFFGVSNANINNKYATFWRFKCQKCFKKLVLWNRHLNAIIWNLKCRRLAFMKLTPGHWPWLLLSRNHIECGV